jgi:zinc transport system substrate-binding protein
MRSASLVVVLSTAVAGLGGLPAAAQSETLGPRVVVTSKPIHALVAGVMQGIAEPTLLVTGTASPHTYAMKPSDAKAVNAARLLFRVSEDLEPFTGKLVKSLDATVRVETLAAAAGLKRLPKREGGAFEDHAGHGSHKAHGGQAETDTHLWLDPDNAGVMLRQIAAVLADVDPANAARYVVNADAFVARNALLAADLRRQLAVVAGRKFIVFHDAYQYFEVWSGLAAAGSITTNPDVQPTGKRLSALRAKIKAAGVVCVFAEPQFQPKVIAAVTEGLVVRTGTLDPEGAMLVPGADLYGQLMRNLTQQLVACLAP